MRDQKQPKLNATIAAFALLASFSAAQKLPAPQNELDESYWTPLKSIALDLKHSPSQYQLKFDLSWGAQKMGFLKISSFKKAKDANGAKPVVLYKGIRGWNWAAVSRGLNQDTYIIISGWAALTKPWATLYKLNPDSLALEELKVKPSALRTLESICIQKAGQYPEGFPVFDAKYKNGKWTLVILPFTAHRKNGLG